MPRAHEEMKCFIYRSQKKSGLYVYLPEKDDFSAIPEDIQKSIGELEFSFELQLHEDRQMARENPVDVINNMNDNGFHLQIPADIEEILASISRGDT